MACSGLHQDSHDHQLGRLFVPNGGGRRSSILQGLRRGSEILEGFDMCGVAGALDRQTFTGSRRESPELTWPVGREPSNMSSASFDAHFTSMLDTGPSFYSEAGGSRAETVLSCRADTNMSRPFAPLTAGGVRQSIFTLVQTALGGGVLTISYMFRMSGIGLGIALLCFCTLIATIGLHIIMRSAVKLKIFTFSGLLIECMGPKSGVFLDVCLFVFSFGTCIAYFIFLGDFIPAIVAIVRRGNTASIDPDELRFYCMLATLFMAIPLSIPNELSALRHISPIALAGILFTTAVVVCQCPFYLAESGFNFEGLVWFKIDRNIFTSFSIAVFAYNCHINVVPVTEELVNPGRSRIFRIISNTVIVQLVLYCLIGAGGYLSFFEKTPASLITAYPNSDSWILVSRVLLSITIVGHIPLLQHPCVRSLLYLFEVCFPSLKDEFDMEYNGKLQPLISGVLVPPVEEGRGKGCLTIERESLRKVLVVCCATGQFCVASKVKNAATVIGILGATISTLMMTVVPILLIHGPCKSLYSPGVKWIFTLLLGVATAMSLASLVPV